MCSGIEYLDALITWQNEPVKLPVRLRNGDITWIRWGELHGRQSSFVHGPCARLDSIQSGKWDRFQPHPVKIPLARYMERDSRGAPVWIKVNPDQHLQGLIATWQGEQRIYVVTVETPKNFRHMQPRWPRLLD